MPLPELEVKRIFAIDIGETETGLIAVVKSIVESKAAIIKAPNMRLMMAEISKIVKKRRSYLRRFPFTPSSILTIEENMAKPARLILPSNGN